MFGCTALILCWVYHCWSKNHCRTCADRYRVNSFILCSGKKGRRKARKTDASDLTPNPQKLHNIGEQLQKLNAAIDGMGPVNDLPAVARARSRKEKNKLASRYVTLLAALPHCLHRVRAPETISMDLSGVSGHFEMFSAFEIISRKSGRWESCRALWFSIPSL